jgi:hypothetical protein
MRAAALVLASVAQSPAHWSGVLNKSPLRARKEPTLRPFLP